MGMKNGWDMGVLADSLLNKIKNAHELQDVAQDIIQAFWDYFGASAVVIDESGKFISFNEKKGNLSSESETIVNALQADFTLNQFFKNYNEIGFNIVLSKIPSLRRGKYEEFSKYFFMILPITFSGKKLAAAIVLSDSPFSDEKIAASKMLLAIISTAAGGLNSIKTLAEKHKNMAVKSALDTLSYSELEAAIYVFEALDSNEGLVTTSKVADAKNLTRSVIVNSLRKLESAGLIESRSLGMKGTFIKIVNEKLPYELNKLRH